MKLLAISDSHGRMANAQHVIEKLADRIAGVLHLGDMCADAQALAANYSDIPFYYVAGNCDYYYTGTPTPMCLTVELGGVNIFLAHGHQHGIKRDYSDFVRAAKEQGAKIAVCGHSHEPFNQKIGGVYVLNPGSIEYPRGIAYFPSYGMIDISESGKIETGIVYLETRK